MTCVKAFEAKMVVQNEGTIWTTLDLADANLARITALLDDGLSIREVAEESGMKRSTIHRMKKAAEAQGHTFPRGTS